MSSFNNSIPQLPPSSHTSGSAVIKVLEKCTKNLIGHSRLVFNNYESNIDC